MLLTELTTTVSSFDVVLHLRMEFKWMNTVRSREHLIITESNFEESFSSFFLILFDLFSDYLDELNCVIHIVYDLYMNYLNEIVSSSQNLQTPSTF